MLLPHLGLNRPRELHKSRGSALGLFGVATGADPWHLERALVGRHFGVVALTIAFRLVLPVLAFVWGEVTPGLSDLGHDLRDLGLGGELPLDGFAAFDREEDVGGLETLGRTWGLLQGSLALEGGGGRGGREGVGRGDREKKVGGLETLGHAGGLLDGALRWGGGERGGRGGGEVR